MRFIKNKQSVNDELRIIYIYKETEIEKRKIEKFSRFIKYITIIIDTKQVQNNDRLKN